MDWRLACATTSLFLSKASGAGPTAISTLHLVRTAGSWGVGVPNAICLVKPQVLSRPHCLEGRAWAGVGPA